MAHALVTGSSTGIGFETALRLAREGLSVTGSVRSEASGAALLEAAGDLDVSLLVMDVDSDESVASAMAELLGRVGTLDVLVNNAGISEGGAVEDTPIEIFQRVMNTNAWGSFRCVKAVIPSMREAGSGCIVNVTSVAGRLPSGGMTAYNMSKFAQEALTECLAQELAPFGIRVAAVEPGVILTPIFEKAMKDPVPPSGPYRRQAERINRMFTSALAQPTMPDQVAGVIWEAISTDTPTLRHPASPDAQSMLATYAAEGADAWMASYAQDSEDGWNAWMGAARGFAVG